MAAGALSSVERGRVPVGIVSVVALIAVWQAVTMLTAPGRLTTSPLSIVVAIPSVVRDGLVGQGLYSLQAFALGMVLAIVIGVALGLLLGRYRRLSYLVDPTLMAFYVTPTIALLPLFVIWMGVGNRSTAAIVLVSAVFPIVVNTIAGMRQGDPSWTRVVRAFGGGQADAFRLAALPGALPEIVLGIRLGVGRGLIGIIVAEMYASSRGIGFLMGQYSHSYRLSELFVVVIAIGIAGFAMVAGMRLVEERVARWRR